MKRFFNTVLVTLVFFTSAAHAQDDMQKKVSSLGTTLGATVGQERRTANGGRVREFEKGAIFWTKNTGARFVGSGVLEKYRELGAESGALGFPVGDERLTDGGLRQTFEHGFLRITGGGDVAAEILPGVTLTADSLMISGPSPIILGMDNDGFLNVREQTGPDITLTCSCEQPPSTSSQRLGFCTVSISRSGKSARCRSADCKGSCSFETTAK